jgi:hypothetical protein
MHYIVTLAEGDFLDGVCVLYNSLVRNGFSSYLIIGYRDLAGFPALSLRSLQQSQQVLWCKLDTPLHFANYKPCFMEKIVADYAECSAITYLDPDIIVNCPCSWFLTWCEGGPAVCADVNWWMPVQHPTRLKWVSHTGIRVNHQLDLYFNSGFLSIQKQDFSFLDLWKHIIMNYGDGDNPLDSKGDIGNWREGGPWLPFFTPDQDALNVALMAWDGPITALGPDVMGFAGPALLPHAVGSAKPWRVNYLRRAMLGQPPRLVDKLYWAQANHPLQSTSKIVYYFYTISLKVASFVGRFYRRLGA